MALSAATAQTAREPSALEVEMLSAHNAYRAQLKLRPLVWSDSLARAAQSWADKLLKRRQFEHESQSLHGENLFEIRGGGATPDDVVQDWAFESLDYDYRSNRCHAVCGHYTQVVWRSTVQLGCAVARGSGREVWVCRYSPPGNVVGQRPY
jgi:pathogenesis-related protein 1